MSVQLDWTTSLPSTSSAAASPARIFPTPAREPGSQVSVPAFGANTLESFASFDPASLSWRTSQRSLLGGWETFSETWPRSGMMQSGIASAPATLGPRIEGSGSSLWPTATAGDHKASGAAGYSTASGRHAGVTLTDAAVRLWPTARARDFKGVGFGDDLPGEVGRQMWPTPSAANPNAQESLETWQARREELKAKGTNGNGCGTPLGVAVRLWPTPRSCSAAAATITEAAVEAAPDRFPNLETIMAIVEPKAIGQSLNPSWVSQLMGFPDGWLDGLPAPAKLSTCGKRRAPSEKPTTEPRDSKPSVTRSSRKSRKSSAES